MKIIIVDDEPKIRGGLLKLFNAKDSWQVTGTFEDGETALEFLKSNSADVIITDIRMQNMSGLELIKKIRQINKIIEVIVLSGYSDFSYAQEAIELGVRSYLTKPTDTKKLVNILTELESKIISLNLEHPPEIANRVVEQIISYIKQNYDKKLTLSHLAGVAHISPNYLCRLFKAHTQQGIIEYLTQYRMEQAKKILKSTNYSISTVAESVGYSDTKYFSIQFKKYCGAPPLEYRNQ